MNNFLINNNIEHFGGILGKSSKNNKKKNNLKKKKTF